MAVYKIPTGNGVGSLNTDIIRTLDLEGVTYDLRFRWNTREETWTILCSLTGGTIIFSTKATVNRIFNSHYKHRTNSPQGDLIIIDTSDTDGRVDFENFSLNGRYRLFYIS